MTANEICRLIHDRRIELGMTMAAVAEKAYCTPQTVCRVEHGYIPTFGVFSSLMSVLGLKVEVMRDEVPKV